MQHAPVREDRQGRPKHVDRVPFNFPILHSGFARSRRPRIGRFKTIASTCLAARNWSAKLD